MKPPCVTCSTTCLTSSQKFFPAPADHLGSSPLDSLQFFNIFLVLLDPKLDKTFQMQYNKCWVKGNYHFLWSTGCRIFNIALDAVSLQHCQGTVLAHVQPTGHQYLGSVSAELLASQAIFRQLINLSHLYLTLLNLQGSCWPIPPACQDPSKWQTISTISPRLVSSVNLMKEAPHFLIQVTDKNTGPGFQCQEFHTVLAHFYSPVGKFWKFRRCCILKSQIMGSQKRRCMVGTLWSSKISLPWTVPVLDLT